MHPKAVGRQAVTDAEIRGCPFAPTTRIESDGTGGKRKSGGYIDVLVNIVAIGRIDDRVGEIVGNTGRRLTQLITARGSDDAHVATTADGKLLRETHRAHGLVEKSARSN